MVGTVIHSLVSQGKRVIIPDFGAFLIKDASLNPVLVKENVTFSPFLRYNDGFLENELAHKCGLHTDEARQRLAAFVETVKDAIVTNEKIYEIPNFGYFFKDSRGNTAFSIDKPMIAKASNMGDDVTKVVEPVVIEEPKPTVEIAKPVVDEAPITVTPVVESKIEEVVEPVKQPAHEPKVAPVEQIVSKPKVETPEIKAPKAVSNEPQKPSEMKAQPNPVISKKQSKESTASSAHSTPSDPRHRSWFVGFVLVAGVLFFLNFFWTDLFGTHSDVHKPKIILDPTDPEEKQAAKDEMKVKDAAQTAIEDEVVSTVEKTVNSSSSKKIDKPVVKKEETVKQESKRTEKKEASSKSSKESSSKTYVVVLGSFQTSESADKHVDNLERKSVKGHVIHRNKVYSVVTKNYKTYEEAEKEMKRFKSQGVDGWISSK